MMPIPVRCGEWDFDFFELQAPSTDQMEHTLHIGADGYTSLLPSEDIWRKFDLFDFPTSQCSNMLSDGGMSDDSELDALRECAASLNTEKDACEIRHHDCMWAGRCGSKDHKTVLVEAAAAAVTRPTARKTVRVINGNRSEMNVITVKPQSLVKVLEGKGCVANSASLLKTDLKLAAPVKTAGRSLLRTSLNVVATTNVLKDTSFSLDSDGGSPRPDTPQTSESEDDCDDGLLFKHNFDISKSVSAVCSDDSNDILSYSGYRTHDDRYSNVCEEEDDDDEDDDDCDDDEDDDDDDDEDDYDNEDVDTELPSTAVDVSEVTGQCRPASLAPQTTSTPHFNSDHSYHLSKTVVRLDNLGVQTPSDSEEEIDVVSFCDGEQPASRSSSCGGSSMPTNPSDLDRQHIQLAVKSAITKKKVDASSATSPAKVSPGRTLSDKIMLDMRTIKKEMPDMKSSYSSKVKNSKKRTATSDRECEEKGRFKGVKRAKHQYHHRMQHHKMMSPARPKKANSTGSSSPRSGCGSSDSEPELEKRSLHNNMERQRRIDLRNLVEGLRLMVPSVENKSRAAKVVILREASNYCQDLTEQYEESSSELAALRQRQNKLRQRVSALRREAAKVR